MDQQKLSMAQEKAVEWWIDWRIEGGLHPKVKEVVSKAKAILKADGDPDPHLDDHWGQRFLDQHWHFYLRGQRNVDNERFKVMTKSVAMKFLTKLEKVLKDDNILPFDEWNFD